MKIIRFLFSPVAMGGLLIVFAIAMAIATFIENDYGPNAAYSMVYNRKWFELILLLLAVNLVGQLIILKLFRKNKLPVSLFHLAFILMIAGAAITRYFGWEGTIHIREGETASTCQSGDNFLGYTVRNESGAIISSELKKYSMTSVSADKYVRNINTGSGKYKLVLSRVIPNATETLTVAPAGEPMVSVLVMMGMQSAEDIILRKGESRNVLGISVGFEPAARTDIFIGYDSSGFYITSDGELGQSSMESRESSAIEPGRRVELKPMQVFSFRDVKIVPQQMSSSAVVGATAVNPDQQNTHQNAFIFSLSGSSGSETIYLWDRESQPSATGSCIVDGKEFTITYGANPVTLPFSLRLDDFVLERYPGSTSPSGYKSNVVLIDKSRNTEKPFSIFMNNILKYRGYRFYQSSFDPDEKGTILSVNHDMAGMIVTYTGYALLFLFIVLSLVSKHSFFRNVKPGAWTSPLRKAVPILFFLFFIQGTTTLNAQKFVPSKEASEEFGKVLVQDQKGRTKPLFTLSSDILRKVTRENKFEGYTPMQIFLGLYFDFDNWKEVPLIRVSNKDIRKKIGIMSGFASFSDLVNLGGGGGYKLSTEVTAAYSKPPSQRDKLDKEVMKVDERVNIIYMIYNGDFMKMFPLKDSTRNWGTADESYKKYVSKEDSLYLKNIMGMMADALRNNNTALVKQISESITAYQTRFSGYDLPSASKTRAELLYYKMGIFERLFPFYATLGLVMLISLIIMVIKGSTKPPVFIKVLTWILFAAYLLHTFGLGLRWYVSGHSPMSNGYESMIFISWVTLTAGFIFSRKSAFALSATSVLAGLTLMVAHMSFMDPEITNLVPVLKSYWLTLHVSVITGSYGFLGLGAILGIVNMILFSLANKRNSERISNTIDELTVINFRTVELGLYFLTIGTFLGAVWANESWGRYWGWDPKETWSLITVIMYTFVTHSRMIPGMKDVYTFNLLSVFGFSGVLMTYFGVNYYLSGLHSYASGDPVPVPTFVYFAVAVLVSLAVLANIKYKKFEKEQRRT